MLEVCISLQTTIEHHYLYEHSKETTNALSEYLLQTSIEHPYLYEHLKEESNALCEHSAADIY